MRNPTRHVTRDGRQTFKIRFRLDGAQTSETFSTRTDAVAFAKLLDAVGPAKALQMLDTEIVTERKVPTMDQLAADHIEHLTGIEPGTRLTYTRLWARTWSQYFGNIPATMLSRDMVAKATNTLADHYSGKSLKNQRGLLAAVCGRAVDLGYLTANPTKRLRLPRGKETEQVEMRVLTQTEFFALLEATPEHWRPLVLYLGGTGCRWGEAVALQVRDVDLRESYVHIRRALKWSPDNARTVGATKTRKSNRKVVLPPELLDVLTVLVDGQAGDMLVFRAPKGGPVQHRTFWSDVWLPSIKRAGIPDPRPRIHDLRHSHASWLLDRGVQIHVVQRRLGHESITTTVDRYGHMMPDAQLQAAQAAQLALTSQ